MSFIRKIKKNGKIYLAEVENQWIDGKCVQKHIRYLGKEVDGEKVISISSKDIQVNNVKIQGPLLILHSIAQKINLPKVLGEYSDEILSVVYAHCMNYKSLRNMPKWYERTDLNLLLNLKSLTEGRLVSAMDYINDDRIERYQKIIFNNVKKIYKLDDSGLVYDTTNTYFHGKKCPMGKIGRSKDGKRKNDLIQIALVTTQKEGVPVFHKTFDGNIHDSRTLMNILDHFSENKIRPSLLVYDRGIVSEKNLISSMKIGLDTLCGLPLREKEKGLIRKFVKKNSINNISNRVKVNKSIFYTVGIPHMFGTVTGKLAICYNESKGLETRESRRIKILEAQALRKESKEVDESFKKYLTPTGRIKKDVLKKEEELDGYMCLFCTKKSISEKEMVRLYFDKDIIEKAFRTMKGVSNIRPIRFWLSNRVKAHVFICYLSYLLLSILNMNLKSKKLKSSPQEAIEELETMYNVYFSDKKKGVEFSKSVTLSKNQEKIIRAVNSKILRSHVVKS